MLKLELDNMQLRTGRFIRCLSITGPSDSYNVLTLGEFVAVLQHDFHVEPTDQQLEQAQAILKQVWAH